MCFFDIFGGLLKASGKTIKIKRSQWEEQALPTQEFTAGGKEGRGMVHIKLFLPCYSLDCPSEEWKYCQYFFSHPLFFLHLPVSSEAECETEAYAGLRGSK